jgi:cobalt-precorrin 5A hydrolase
MMLALISLSGAGARLARILGERLPRAEIFLHGAVAPEEGGTRFRRVLDLVGEIFDKTEGIVFIGPCGVAVRAVAPHVRSKLTDPPVVVVDACGRYAVSLLSGHEGGANDLAVTVGNILGAEPIVTTTTEAMKTIIVGVGCRRGCAAATIVEAVTLALQKAEVELDQVRYIASADVKEREEGLIQAARELGVPLRLITSEEIRACGAVFERSAFVEEKVKLPAVAEPAALLAGRRTRLILPKTIHNGVTVAMARENFL